jgi:hypothetical protein
VCWKLRFGLLGCVNMHFVNVNLDVLGCVNIYFGSLELDVLGCVNMYCGRLFHPYGGTCCLLL